MLDLTRNRELKKRYEQVFSGQSRSFFTFNTFDESVTIYQMCSWDEKRVLEIGCGEGHLANLMAVAGATVTAIDYAAAAIIASNERYHNIPNLKFVNCSFEEVKEQYDVVVMQGVLEHMDDPLSVLQFIKSNLLVKEGEIITSSPSFLNARGYIWMALQYLFDIPMSLTDVQLLCPFDFEEFAKELGMKMRFITIEQDWACGQKLIQDFKKRLPNACRDKGIEANVDRFIDWLEKAVRYPPISDWSGALAIYHFFQDA
ncbi:class I SAM-dependent methyltransferase [Chloroflexota bacterium]